MSLVYQLNTTITHSFVHSLAEQVKARERQEEKERRMTIELKVAISDRDIFKKNQHVLRDEMEKVKAELALTQAKYVLCHVRVCFITVRIFWVCCPASIVSTYDIDLSG